MRTSAAASRGPARSGPPALLTSAERDALLEGLDQVAARIEREGLADAPEEDIHSVVERMLGEAAGPVAGKLHTGRSRNDQSATGVRLYGMRQTAEVTRDLLALTQALHGLAERGVDVVMPGYTHLQQAQPIRAAHWALSHVFAFLRDLERVACRGSVGIRPAARARARSRAVRFRSTGRLCGPSWASPA